MAIFHLSVKTVSRSAGRSATAAAAYRAGCKITDERTGEIHDYTRKGGVESAAVILPDNAPEWARDRAQLWNAAEQAEKRKNSTVAREFEIALPAELSPAEREKLAHDFARELVNRHGMAADVAIHAPGKEGDNRNHHAHILLTTRRLGPDGLGEKTRELDDQKTGKELVKQWRERFATLQNERLREAGHAVQVDHRSHAERGLEAEPTRHLGPTASAIERRTGERSRKGQQHDQDALERLARAKALGELERQGKAADRSIIDLSGDIEAAKRDRAQQQEREAQAERQRIERMTSTELAAEIGRLRPPRVLDLVERDPAVLRAEAERQALQNRHTEAGSASARARDQAQAWREAHKVQAWLHDRHRPRGPAARAGGTARSEPGRVAEAGAADRAGRLAGAAPAKPSASAHQRRAGADACQGGRAGGAAPGEGAAGVRAAESASRPRRRPSASGQPCRRTSGQMAAKREAKASGWSDRGEQWKAAPQGLRTLIDGYNAAPKEMRPAILDRILNDGQRREQVRELMAEQRQQYRANDRGMER